MTNVRGILGLVGIPALLLAGVVVSASGCGSSGPPACSPDLYVNVRIVDTNNVQLTCDEVPATTVRVNVSGVVTDFSCPTGVSQQQLPFFLDVTGTYTVMVQLLDGGTVLSSTGTNSIDVDCSGQTQTPLIDLVVL
jgi:hypothetical protein